MWVDSSMISRPLFLASALAAAATGPVLAQSMVQLRCASAPDDDVSSFLYARDSGLFTKAGMEVTIDRLNSGSAVAAAVAGGSLDLGKSSVISLIAAHQKGLPFVVIAPAGMYDADHPDVAMLVAKDASLRTARDIVGKTIAVAALGDLYAIANAAYIDAAGASWKEVKYLEMPSASAPDALVNHRIDAVTLATPALSMALAAGKVRVLGHPFDAISKHFLRAVWFTTKPYAVKNADLIARFRRVIETASAEVNAHPAATVKALAAFSGMDPEVISHMPRALAGTTLEAKLLQPTIDAAYRYGAIAAKFDAQELMVPG
jgi:NitT/TauT family transport system substrate-binding protein